jgi:hypothetical protein
VGDCRRADRAAAATLILDNDSTEAASHPLGPVAPHRIDNATRRIRNNKTDGLVRIFRLCAGDPAGQELRRNRGGSEAKASTTIHRTTSRHVSDLSLDNICRIELCRSLHTLTDFV